MSGKASEPAEALKVPQHDLTAYARGKGIGESLVDLARHRRAEDVPGPFIFIGVLLVALAGAGSLILFLSSNAARPWSNFLFLLAIAILGMVFAGIGLGFRVTTRRTRVNRHNEQTTH